MSVQALAWVLQHSEARNGARLVLISLANYAQDDGTQAFPSIETLCENSRLSRSAVKSALARLRADGSIVETGRRSSGTAVFSIVMGGQNQAGSDSARADSGAGGSDSDAQGPDPDPDPYRTTTTRQGLSNPDSVDAVFDYWRERCNHPTAKLTSDRRSKINARLRDGYTVDDLKAAVDGAARAAFVNDQGKRFDDLALICRNGEKLDSFIARASTTTTAGGLAARTRARRERIARYELERAA